MPRQNRVNPFGEIVAAAARGTRMGNRGCLHDEGDTIRRPFANRRWIQCVLDFNGRRRTIMAPRRYTELFFLDEATGLAAGHRPCAECQSRRYRRFREVWAKAFGGDPPSADAMDLVLHQERLGPGKTKRTFEAKLGELPLGTMVVKDGAPYLVLEATLRPWSFAGYGEAIPKEDEETVEVLTPPSIVRIIRAGFEVDIHPSAFR